MKNNDKLFDEIGKLDDKLVPAIVKEKSRKKPLIIGTCGAAAAAVAGVMVLQSVGAGQTSWAEYQIYPPYDYRENITVKDELPQIPHIVHSNGVYWDIESEAMSLLFYKEDVENNLITNPWNKRQNEEAAEDNASVNEIKNLPVFKNNFFDDYGPAMEAHLSEERLTEMLNNTAASMGLAPENQEFYYEDYSDLPIWYSADCDGEKYGVRVINIVVYGDGGIRINFNFYGEEGDHPYYIPEAEELDSDGVLKLLTEKFGNLMQYENPALKSFEDNPLSGRKYVIYNASDDPVQDMLNYASANVTFSFSEENSGELLSINMYNSLIGMECVGEYPIITLDKARELLNRSCYIKRFPDSFFKNNMYFEADDIVGAELVYFDINDEYFKPYYRFYVELGCTFSDDRTVYGDLYVPAIEGRYVDSYNYSNPDFTGEVYESFPDVIALPDGSTVNKSEAVSAFTELGVPKLAFKFGYMRYAEPICMNTLDHPDCFDFETQTFKEEINADFEPEYFMVKPGDYLAKDDMKVQNAEYIVALENGEAVFSGCYVNVYGLSLEGLLTCEPEEEQPLVGEPVMGLYFYADPVDSWERPLPVIYDPDGVKLNEKILDEAAIVTDGFKSCIRIMSPYDNEAEMLGYGEILDGTKTVRAAVSTSEVSFYSDSEGVRVDVHMLEFAVPRNYEE